MVHELVPTSMFSTIQVVDKCFITKQTREKVARSVKPVSVIFEPVMTNVNEVFT